MKRVLIGVLSIVGLGLIVLGLMAVKGHETNAQNKGEPLEPRVNKINVQTMEVRPTPIRDIMLLPGETKPWLDVTLATDHAGLIEWVGVREGDAVKKGDLIMRIDVSALKAALDNARASFKLADDLYRRRRNLFERNIISQEDLDQAMTERAVAEGILRQATVNHENGFLHSPLDGIINKLHVDQGEFVGRGEPVADLVNVDKVEIRVNVPELDVRFLAVKQPVMVTIDALPERKIGGVVDFVSFKADAITKTFQVKIMVDNEDKSVRAGMIARVAFQRRIIPDALIAPLFALVDRGGERLLYVEKDGVAQARVVDIGVIEGDRVQITGGLEPGDQLIVSGQNDVQEGTIVQVAP
jgi:membrane fusion protein, multidrug efflux system